MAHCTQSVNYRELMIPCSDTKNIDLLYYMHLLLLLNTSFPVHGDWTHRDYTITIQNVIGSEKTTFITHACIIVAVYDDLHHFIDLRIFFVF